MAEDTLVKEVLTDNMIEAGRALVNTLEQKGASIVAAFWLYDWENNRWKLTFVFPNFDKAPRAVISEVLDAHKITTPAVDFLDLSYLSPKDRRVRELQEHVDGGRNLENRRHRGRAVEDSYVYRVRPTASAA